MYFNLYYIILKIENNFKIFNIYNTFSVCNDKKKFPTIVNNFSQILHIHLFMHYICNCCGFVYLRYIRRGQ